MKKYFLLFIMISTLANLGMTQDTPKKVGINLAGIADWSTQHPFVDVFKTARPWISQRNGANWGEGGDLLLTPEGWVAELEKDQYAETLMFSSDPSYNAGLDGEYTLLYEGEGEITFRGNNVQIITAQDGRITLDVKPSLGAVFLQVIKTNPNNPIRNIRFLMPNTESTYQTQPFNPVFLERIAPFGVLRFMDWMYTNNSIQQDWENRPQVSDYTFAWRGVPVEVMIQLANVLQADAWFNMPHLATDDYVRQFAVIVRDTLAPNLKVYIEYSNETWNGQFEQAWYVSDEGIRLSLAGNDSFWSGLKYYSQRAVEHFKIWEEVFGSTERLIRVLASQAANAWTAEQILLHNDAYQHADAIAIAPYFSCSGVVEPENSTTVIENGLDALLGEELANVQQNGCAGRWIQDNIALVEQYGLELLAYEGGQHLAGVGAARENAALTALFIEANRSEPMKTIYETYFETWETLGGGVFVVFSDFAEPSKYGSWGLLESVTQDPSTAPKYQAVLSYIDKLRNR